MKLKNLAIYFALAPAVVSAWSGDGHIQIADIAWTKLTPKAQQRVAEILAAGEPTFRPMNGNVRDAFGKAATWSDYIKGKNESIYDDLITTYNRKFEPNIESTGSEGVRCKTWHYYDIPIRYKGAEPKVRPSNALVALNLAFDELKKLQSQPNADLKLQCWWLYWITHVVGDLHQPLHCTSNHEVHEDGDDGGNKYNITAPDQDRKIRLHGFWDAGIGRAIGREREAGLSPNVQDVTSRWLLEEKLQPVTAVVKDIDVMNWLKFGAAMADQKVYTGIQENERPSAEYIESQISLSKKQAVLAGYRLAEILNRTL